MTALTKWYERLAMQHDAVESVRATMKANDMTLKQMQEMLDQLREMRDKNKYEDLLLDAIEEALDEGVEA